MDVKDKKKWLENAFKKKGKAEEATATTSASQQSRDLVENRHQWIQDKLLTKPKEAPMPQPSGTEASKPKEQEFASSEEKATQAPSMEKRDGSNPTSEVSPEVSTNIATNGELLQEDAGYPNANDAHANGAHANDAESMEENNDGSAELARDMEDTCKVELNKDEVQIEDPSGVAETDLGAANTTPPAVKTIPDETNSPFTETSEENQKEVIDAPATSKTIFTTEETIDEPPVEYPEEAIDPLPEESDDEDEVEESIEKVAHQIETPRNKSTLSIPADAGEGVVLDKQVLDLSKEPSTDLDSQRIAEPTASEAAVVATGAENDDSSKTVEDEEALISKDEEINIDAADRQTGAKAEEDVEKATEISQNQGNDPSDTTVENQQQTSTGKTIAMTGPHDAEKLSTTTNQDAESAESEIGEIDGEAQPKTDEEPYATPMVTDKDGTAEAALSNTPIAENRDGTELADRTVPEPVETDGFEERKPEDVKKLNEKSIPDDSNKEQLLSITTSIDEGDAGEEQIEMETVPKFVSDEDPVFLGDFESPHKEANSQTIEQRANGEESNKVDNKKHGLDAINEKEQLVSITTSIDEEDVCEQQFEITPKSKAIGDEDPVFLGDFESPHKQPQSKTTEVNLDELQASSSDLKSAATNEGLLLQDTTEETVMASNSDHQHDKKACGENVALRTTDSKIQQRSVRVKDIVTSMSSESSTNRIGLTPLAQVPVHSSTNPNSPANAGDQGVNKHVIDMSKMEFLHTRKGKAFVEQAKKNAKKLREVKDDILGDEFCAGVLGKATVQEDLPQQSVTSLLDTEKSDNEVTDSSDVHYSKESSIQPMSPSKQSEADSSAEVKVHCLESCSIM